MIVNTDKVAPFMHMDRFKVYADELDWLRVARIWFEWKHKLRGNVQVHRDGLVPRGKAFSLNLPGEGITRFVVGDGAPEAGPANAPTHVGEAIANTPETPPDRSMKECTPRSSP